jgi:hypothetical protein
MTHVTHAQAFDALADPEVPMEKAMKLFERAYKRSGPATRDFILDVTGNFRETRVKPLPVKLR